MHNLGFLPTAVFILTVGWQFTGIQSTAELQTMASTGTDNLKILIFLGSTRKGRMVERVGKLVNQVVLDNGGMEVIIFDPEKMPFEMLKEPLHFMENPERDAPQWLKDANKQIKEADGFLIISPEYNCAIPPALTNMMDHFPPSSFRHRPAGIITYSMGSFGGMRVSALLRPFLSELGMVTVPNYVPIPVVQDAIQKDGKCENTKIFQNIVDTVKEVGQYAKALSSIVKQFQSSEKSN